MKKRTKIIIIAVITIVVLIAGGCGAYFGYFKPHNEAVDTYNVVISNIKEKNKQLDTEIKKLQKLVDNTDKPLDKSTVDAAKEAIKDAGASKIVVGEMPKGTEDILNKAKELSVPIDYSDKITALSDAYTNLENSKKQYKQVTNPTEEFVIQRLLTVDDIVDAIKNLLERTPPELTADIVDAGIYLTGASSSIKNLDKLIKKETDLNVNVIKNPGESVIRGISIIMSDSKYRKLMYEPKESTF